jgi:hypothetical protein
MKLFILNNVQARRGEEKETATETHLDFYADSSFQSRQAQGLYRNACCVPRARQRSFGLEHRPK